MKLKINNNEKQEKEQNHFVVATWVGSKLIEG
jgi:hypothetical protein